MIITSYHITEVKDRPINCQMLSETNVPRGHDGRLGGSRRYIWWQGGCSICRGWPLRRHDFRTASCFVWRQRLESWRSEVGVHSSRPKQTRRGQTATLFETLFSYAIWCSGDISIIRPQVIFPLILQKIVTETTLFTGGERKIYVNALINSSLSKYSPAQHCLLEGRGRFISMP